MDLFVAFMGENHAIGNVYIENISEPQNYDEIRSLEKYLSDKNKIKVQIINWKAIRK